MNTLTKAVVDWIKNYFETTHGENAVIGISGGKDSAIVAALCCKALGKDHVIGVMMPNGEQKDIDDSKKICEYLGIRTLTVDISAAYNDLRRCIYCADDNMPELSEQTKINLAPRIRMTTLYGIAQTLNGRVSCNSNLCERMMGYSTLWGDSVGDFAPIADLSVNKVLKIGDDLGLPYEIVHKVPTDGLSEKSDEEKMGFTYGEVELWMHGEPEKMKTNPTAMKIQKKFEENKFKMDMINIPHFDLNEWHMN